MRRFIVPSIALSDDSITVSGEIYHHIAHVLRLAEGSRISLVDGSGNEYRGRISQVGGGSLTVTVEESLSPPMDTAATRITIFQGLPKGDRFEFVIQKCTELGVDEIVAWVAARSVSRPSDDRIKEKLRRWNRIAMEASRQANRLTVPRIGFAPDLAELCRGSNHGLRILLWEGERNRSLREFIGGVHRPDSVAVMIGPEGGLTAEEVEAASESGFVAVSLGERIMRTETAAMAMAAILQFHWGDLG